MAELLETLTTLAGDGLQDEQPLAAISVNYAGKINLEQNVSGLATLYQRDHQVAAGEELAERIASKPNATFPSAKAMSILLTEKRLIVWSRGGLSNKPKTLIGSVPLEAVEKVRYADGRLNSHLTVKMWTGWEISLDPVGKAMAPEFAEELARLVDEINGREPAASNVVDFAAPGEVDLGEDHEEEEEEEEEEEQ